MSIIKRPAPMELENLTQAWLPELNALHSAMVCGGFVRSFYAGMIPNDMDLYFQRPDQADHAIQILTKAYGEPTFVTPRAVSFITGKRHLVQVIKFTFGPPEQILEAFDFTVCQAAYCPNPPDPNADGPMVYLSPRFFEDLAARVLIFTGSAMPLSSLKRAFKFTRQGFGICDENIIALVEAITKAVDFDDYRMVNEHIEGMDPNGDRRIRLVD